MSPLHVNDELPEGSPRPPAPGGRGPCLPTIHVAAMSLRDYFAAKAMQSILAVLHEGIHPDDVPSMCRDAYGIADAMLAERKKAGVA